MARKNKTQEVDDVDINILSILAFDAKTPYSNIENGHLAECI